MLDLELDGYRSARGGERRKRERGMEVAKRGQRESGEGGAWRGGREGTRGRKGGH